MDRSDVAATYVDGAARYVRGEAFSLKPAPAEIDGAVAALKSRRRT
jgi:hypothetical protein